MYTVVVLIVYNCLLLMHQIWNHGLNTFLLIGITVQNFHRISNGCEHLQVKIKLCMKLKSNCVKLNLLWVQVSFSILRRKFTNIMLSQTLIIMLLLYMKGGAIAVWWPTGILHDRFGRRRQAWYLLRQHKPAPVQVSNAQTTPINVE